MNLSRRTWLLGGLSASAVAISGFVWFRWGGSAPPGIEKSGVETPSPRRVPLPTNHLRYLPADTRIVVTINPAALPDDGKHWRAVGNRLYDAHLTPRKGGPAALAAVNCITVGMPNTGSSKGTIVVRGKVNRPLLAEQLEANKEWRKGAGQPPVYSRSAEVESPMSVGSLALAASTVSLVAVDDDTLLLAIEPGVWTIPRWLPDIGGFKKAVPSPGEDRLRNSLKTPAKSTPGLDPMLVKLVENLDPEAWLSFAILGDSLASYQKPAMPDVNATFQKFDHLVASMRSAAESELTITATGKDETRAREMETDAKGNAQMLKSVIPALGAVGEQKQVLEELFGSLQVTRHGRVVIVRTRIDSEKTKVFAPRP